MPKLKETAPIPRMPFEVTVKITVDATSAANAEKMVNFMLNRGMSYSPKGVIPYGSVGERSITAEDPFKL